MPSHKTQGSRRFYDFECEDCGEVTEDFCYESTKEVVCPVCKGTAKRTISLPRIDWRKMGVDPDFPSASDKWVKMQKQKARTDKGSLRGDGAPNLKMY